jgi:hypothetical protein
MELGVRHLRKLAEFAPGLPSRSRYEPLPSVTAPKPFKLNIQRHVADRAGEHLDLRLVDPDTGLAHSWALKKWPAPGTGTYAPQQPTHEGAYAGWSGTIPTGTYGAGTVESQRLEDAEVIHSSPNELRFNLYSGKIPEQLVLKRTSGDRMWVLHNATPSRHTKHWAELLPNYKPSLGHVQFKALDPTKSDEIWQPKIDGAHGIVVAEGGKPVRLFSYRDAKNETGLIEHTHKLPEWWKNVAPAGLKPTVLRAEITGRDSSGKPVPSATIGGILNATVPHSRQMQTDQGVNLRLIGFRVQREDGKVVPDNAPYKPQLSTIRRLAADIPVLYPMPTAENPQQKAKLLADVASGHHSLTGEGVVVIKPQGTYKAPITETHDVTIRKILPSIREGEAGGFEFSWGDGPVVGVVGTGFTHAQKREMLAKPADWEGRVVKVTAKQRFPSGALRGAAYVQEHESKSPTPFG